MTKINKDYSEWLDVINDADIASITLGELIDSTAKKYPDNEALVYSNQPDVSDIRWTYKYLSESSTDLAKGFLDAWFHCLEIQLEFGGQIIPSGF